VDVFPLPLWQLFPPLLQSDQYRLCLLGQYRIATACKGEYGAIPAIASSPAIPNAWPPRAELTPIAVSILSTYSPASGDAPIDTESKGNVAIPSLGNNLAAIRVMSQGSQSTMRKNHTSSVDHQQSGGSEPAPQRRPHSFSFLHPRSDLPGLSNCSFMSLAQCLGDSVG
jgi:hypothetical protein